MDKKIAIFHNFLDNIGGSEVVALTLARELKADLYTTNINFEKIKKMGFVDVLPRIFSIGKVSIFSPFRQQQAFFRFRRLNLYKNYDFYIIAGDWAMSGAVNNHPNLWYVHSPLNEIWGWKHFIKDKYLFWWQKPVFDFWVWFNRKISLKYSKFVDNWVSNSINTQDRIKKYYKKSALIINPPIYTSNYSFKKRGDYWLSVNRLAKNKRIELQLKAFSEIPEEKLIIVGSYEKRSKQFESYKKYLEKIKPWNAKIIHWVDSLILRELYANCKGFITTSRDEDFGMAPLEAMSSGKLVIAPNEGGYKETILDKKTGVLIDNIDKDKIIKTIRGIYKKVDLDNSKEECIRQALNFDTKIFIQKINQIIAPPHKSEKE